jgi:hypothetical protein
MVAQIDSLLIFGQLGASCAVDSPERSIVRARPSERYVGCTGRDMNRARVVFMG